MKSKKLTFIDLFAGIGGIRLGFEQAGFRCVYSNERDKSAAATYATNHGNDIEVKDIREVDEKDIPHHDILCAGFPCQPFSRAGVSARVSSHRKHGFEDKDQGVMFFEIIRILRYHRPKAVFLENVSNFERHDKGNTLRIVREELEALGYTLSAKVIDASLLVPHRRKRIYMVALKKSVFRFPEIEQKQHCLSDILEKKAPDIYTISNLLWKSHQERTIRNKKKGNGFAHYLIDPKGVANTLTSRYGKDGRENLVPQKGKNPRMLTPRECARLMGFPESFILPATKTPAYRQFGNSVCVPVIKTLATSLKKQLKNETSTGKRIKERRRTKSGDRQYENYDSGSQPVYPAISLIQSDINPTSELSSVPTTKPLSR
jgi:DNA (cytosine-5)-methyltransferase 1